MKAKSKQKNLVIIAVLLLALMITAIVARNNLWLGQERAIIGIFYTLPESLDIIVVNITHFGSLATLYSAVAVLLIMGFKKLSFLLLANSMVAYVVATILKEIIMRPRPPYYWSEIAAREWGPVSFGFPSGHAALITVMAVTMWPYVKKSYRVWLVVIVLLVSASRMVLGVHLPLDVIGGIFIGIIVALSSRILLQNKIKNVR